MQHIENFHARSGSVLIKGDVAVVSFLAEINGQPNIAVSMKVHVLELLQSRIERALAAQPRPAPEAG